MKLESSHWAGRQGISQYNAYDKPHFRLYSFVCLHCLRKIHKNNKMSTLQKKMCMDCQTSSWSARYLRMLSFMYMHFPLVKKQSVKNGENLCRVH